MAPFLVRREQTDQSIRVYYVDRSRLDFLRWYLMYRRKSSLDRSLGMRERTDLSENGGILFLIGAIPTPYLTWTRTGPVPHSYFDANSPSHSSRHTGQTGHARRSIKSCMLLIWPGTAAEPTDRKQPSPLTASGQRALYYLRTTTSCTTTYIPNPG